MSWCLGSRRADPFSDDEGEGFQERALFSSLRLASASVSTQEMEDMLSEAAAAEVAKVLRPEEHDKEMEAVLSKAAAAHAEGDWAGGRKQQVSHLDGHAQVALDLRPEEHDKMDALAKAYQKQEQLVQALQGQVTSWAAKMENMQASQNEMRSMLASLVGKAGDKGAAPEAQDQALAQKLPEACADLGLSGETGAAVAAGWDKSNAERDVLATLTQRITALESASQRLAATENGLADLKWLCTRKDGMGLVPRLEMAHALESAQACLPKRGVQPAITDRQQQFYTEIKAKAISAEVLDKVLVEVEPVVESALEGTREAWQHAEKISNDVQDLQHSVKQADKKVEDLSRTLVKVANKLYDRLVKLDAAQQQLVERLCAWEEKTEGSPSIPSESMDKKRTLLRLFSDEEKTQSTDKKRTLIRFYSDQEKERRENGALNRLFSNEEKTHRENGASGSYPLTWPHGPQRVQGDSGALRESLPLTGSSSPQGQGSWAQSPAAASSRRQSQAGQSFQGRSRESEEQFRAVPRHYSASTTGCVPQSDQGCSTKLEEQFKAVLRRRSEMGDVAVVSGKLPDELLDSFGSSMVLLLQPPPQSKSSTHASHSGGVPKQKGFTTDSMCARPAPPSKGTRRPSLEDEDDDAVKLLEQERILFTKKGSTFSRPTEVTMTPALAAYAASGNKGRPPGQFTDPKLASSRSTRPSSEGDSLRMRKLD